MSQIFYNYFLKKTNLDQVLKVSGVTDDPYFEDIPEDDLHFYQRKGAKRKRRLPGFIAPHDLKVLESVKRKAYRLDLQLSICGFRLGWAGIIGLIPWIGDLIAVALALQLVRKAQKIEGGLPGHLRQKMMANIAFDFGIGLIPIVGDLVNIAYKCNSRNFVMLEKYLVEKYQKQTASAISSDPSAAKENPNLPPRDKLASNAKSETVKSPQVTPGYGDPARAV